MIVYVCIAMYVIMLGLLFSNGCSPGKLQRMFFALQTSLRMHAFAQEAIYMLFPLSLARICNVHANRCELDRTMASCTAKLLHTKAMRMGLIFFFSRSIKIKSRYNTPGGLDSWQKSQLSVNCKVTYQGFYDYHLLCRREHQDSYVGRKANVTSFCWRFYYHLQKEMQKSLTNAGLDV